MKSNIYMGNYIRDIKKNKSHVENPESSRIDIVREWNNVNLIRNSLRDVLILLPRLWGRATVR